MFLGIISIIVTAVVSIGLKLLAGTLQKTPEQEFNESLPNSNYRVAIPKPYNLYRYRVNWIEPKGEDEAFWKKNRGSGRNKRKVLFGRFLGIVCNAETDWVAFWVNSRGRANALHTDQKALNAGNKFVETNIDWMDGSHEQRGWSKGRLEIANKPLLDQLGSQYSQRRIGYRGITCVGFTDADLSEDFKSNSFPTVDTLVRTKTRFDLAAINADICKDADIEPSEIDVTEIVGIEVLGFDRPQNGETYAENIANLAAAFRFFAAETTEGILSFRRFERPSARQLEWQDLVPLEDGRLWAEDSGDIRDLPETILINFIDPEQNYLGNSVPSDIEPRAVNHHQDSISLSVIMSEAQAKDLANWHLNQLWIRYKSYKYRLTTTQLEELNIGDVLVLPDGTHTQVQNFKLGSNYLIEVQAVRYDNKSQNTLATVANKQPLVQEPVITQVGDARSYNEDGTVNYGTLYLLDIPAADSSHSELGFYCLSDRPNSTVFINQGNGFEEELTFVDAATFGSCDSVLPSIDNTNIILDNLPLIDATSILEVTIESGSLVAEITNSRFINQEQVGFIGRYDGVKWVGEYVGFQFADSSEPNKFKLQNLLRGLYGTEYYIDRHQSGEKFFLLKGDTAYWERVIYSHTQIGQSMFGKLQVVLNQDLTPTPSVTVNLLGQSIYPYSPVNVELTEDPEGNLVIDFQSRERGIDRSLGETEDLYELDIFQSGTVIRTLTSTESLLVYPQAQRMLDQVANSLDANIYKVSTLVNRGNPNLLRNLTLTGTNNTIVTPGGGESRGFKYIDQNYEILPEDNCFWLLVNTNSSDINITLPEIPTTKLWIQNVSKNRVNLVGNLTAIDNQLRQNEAVYLLNRNNVWHGMISGRIEIPKHMLVSGNFTLSPVHHNKIVSVQSATNITCTLKKSDFDNPQDFQTTIRKKGDGDIYFQSEDTIEAAGTTLGTKYAGVYIGYEGNGVWIILGALQY